MALVSRVLRSVLSYAAYQQVIRSFVLVAKKLTWSTRTTQTDTTGLSTVTSISLLFNLVSWFARDTTLMGVGNAGAPTTLSILMNRLTSSVSVVTRS
jgi:hypothetical protein